MKGDDKVLRSGGIVFYAESPAYWGTFEPVLRALSEMGQSVTYLTSAENDPVFEAQIPDVSARYIGKGNSAYTSLGFLEADIFVLTTPGIDVLQIRRSKGVKRYVHLVHAATDAHGYKLFSFDYYDAVYCSGEHQRRSLRLLEAKRGTAPKDLPLLGCPYFDRMVAKRRNYRAEPEARTVLVAPTWAVRAFDPHGFCCSESSGRGRLERHPEAAPAELRLRSGPHGQAPNGTRLLPQHPLGPSARRL